MGRPKSKSKFKLFKRNINGIKFWYYQYDNNGKPKQKATGKRCDFYTHEQIEKILNTIIGIKTNITENSIEGFENNILYELEIEGISEKTIKLYRNAFAHLKALYGCNYNIFKFDRSMIKQMQKHLHEKDLSNATINTYLRQINAAFERLVFDGRLNISPLYRFKRLPENERRSMTDEETTIFINALSTEKDERLKRLLRISLFTGRRRTEVLYFESINLDKCTYIFQDIKERKNKGKKIICDFPEQIWSDLKYFVDRNPGAKYPLMVWKPDTYTHKVKKLLRRVGLPEDLRLHSCRYTAITRSLDNEQDIRKVQKIMHHSGVRMTEHYGKDRAKGVLNIGLE